MTGVGSRRALCIPGGTFACKPMQTIPPTANAVCTKTTQSGASPSVGSRRALGSTGVTITASRFKAFVLRILVILDRHSWINWINLDQLAFDPVHPPEML